MSKLLSNVYQGPPVPFCRCMSLFQRKCLWLENRRIDLYHILHGIPDLAYHSSENQRVVGSSKGICVG